MAVFILIYWSHPYRWAAVVPDRTNRSWPLNRRIHMPRTELGIVLSRQKVYPHLFTFTMLLPMAFEKEKKITFLRFLLLSFNLVKQVLEAVPRKHQLYGHLPPITKIIKIRQTRHAGHGWRSRDEFIRDVLLWTPSHVQVKAGGPARTYIQQLCADTGCSSEDLPETVDDRKGWRERSRPIRADRVAWWWWWWWLSIYLGSKQAS